MKDIDPKTRDEAVRDGLWQSAIPAGAVIAYAIAALFNCALTVAKELLPPVKAAMASAAGHHWPAHAIANAVVFALVWFALRKKSGLRNAPAWIVGSTVVSSAVILAFYMVHWWGAH